MQQNKIIEFIIRVNNLRLVTKFISAFYELENMLVLPYKENNKSIMYICRMFNLLFKSMWSMCLNFKTSHW